MIHVVPNLELKLEERSITNLVGRDLFERHFVYMVDEYYSTQ